MPKVSVIVPVYGTEEYIERCARSLFEQTLDDMEFLFIDDCTPDNSIGLLKDILEEYPQRKHQVKIHRMQNNSGQAEVRKWGILNAKGDYTIHCDSDDWMESNMCKIMYEKALVDKADLVFCDYFINSEKDETVFQRGQLDYSDKDDLFRNILLKSWLNPIWSVLVKTELYKHVSFPRGAQSEDKTYLIQLLFFSNKNSRCGVPLYHYRKNPKSITNSIDINSIIKRYLDIEMNRELIEDFSNNNNLIQRYPLEFQVYFFTAKGVLSSYLHNNTCRTLWINSFPNSNIGILSNPYLSIQDKINYIVCRLRVFLFCCL